MHLAARAPRAVMQSDPERGSEIVVDEDHLLIDQER